MSSRHMSGQSLDRLKRHVICIFAGLAVACSLPAFARSTRHKRRHKHYPLSVFTISSTPQEFEKEMPPVPAANSTPDKADLVTVLQWQKVRTKAQCDRAISENDAGHAEQFFGPKFHMLTEAELKRLSPFLHQVFLLAGHYVHITKDDFKRPRPFVGHADVTPCTGKSKGFSYPSGHTTISRLMALSLGDVDPAHSAQFLERADQVARDRIIGGVHYPSDINAGKKLADLIFAQLSKNPKFQSDVESLKSKMKITLLISKAAATGAPTASSAPAAKSVPTANSTAATSSAKPN